MHNLLFDPSTNRLTALLDYDFGHIGSLADEYFYSFPALGSLFVGPYDACSARMVDLRRCLLTNFPADAAARPTDDVDWKAAVAFDAALTTAGAKRPRDIEGIDVLSAVYWFIQNISPQEFFIKKMRARMTPEWLAEKRVKQQKELETYLDAWGY